MSGHSPAFHTGNRTASTDTGMAASPSCPRLSRPRAPSAVATHSSPSVCSQAGKSRSVRKSALSASSVSTDSTPAKPCTSARLNASLRHSTPSGKTGSCPCPSSLTRAHANV